MTIMLDIATLLQSGCFACVRDSGNIFDSLRSHRFYCHETALHVVHSDPTAVGRFNLDFFSLRVSDLLQSDGFHAACLKFAAIRLFSMLHISILLGSDGSNRESFLRHTLDLLQSDGFHTAFFKSTAIRLLYILHSSVPLLSDHSI